MSKRAYSEYLWTAGSLTESLNGFPGLVKRVTGMALILARCMNFGDARVDRDVEPLGG